MSLNVTEAMETDDMSQKGTKINFDTCYNMQKTALNSNLKSVWPETFNKYEFLMIYFGINILSMRL